MNRLHLNERLWRLDWSEFEVAASRLAEQLQGLDAECVVAIARGGLTLGERLASALTTPLVAVRAQGNERDEIGSPPAAVVRLDASSLGDCAGMRRIVLCDDIVGGGATLSAVSAALLQSAPEATLATAALCCNAYASPQPDLWIWTVSDWVLFPWEQASGRWRQAQSLHVPAPSQRRAR